MSNEPSIDEEKTVIMPWEKFHDFAVLEEMNGNFESLIGKHAEMCTKHSRGFEEREDIPELRFYGTIVSLHKESDTQYIVKLLIKTGHIVPFNINVNWQFLTLREGVPVPDDYVADVVNRQA